MYPGPFCEKHDLSEDKILNKLDSLVPIPGLQNGLVLELRAFIKKCHKRESELVRILTILEPRLSAVSDRTIMSKIGRVFEKRKRLSHHKKTGGFKDATDLLNRQFEPPITKTGVSDLNIESSTSLNETQESHVEMNSVHPEHAKAITKPPVMVERNKEVFEKLEKHIDFSLSKDFPLLDSSVNSEHFSSETTALFKTKTMSSESKPSKTKGFKFSSKIDLDAIILSAINDLCDPKTNKEASNFDAELEKLQVQVKIAERKQHEINKIFNNCHSHLDVFKNDLESTEQADEAELKAAQEAVFEASKQPSEITIVDSDGPDDDDDKKNDDNDDDDDDDDVQFITKTFDPEIAAKRQAHTQQMQQRSPGRASQPGSQPNQSLTGQSRSALAAALTASGNHDNQLKQHLSSPPTTIASARAAFTAMVNQRYGQSTILRPGFPPFNPQQPRPAPPGGVPYPSSLANQEKMEKAFLEDVNKVAVGSVILANRYNDVWDKATITEIHSHELVEERKYKVKFEGKKQTKTLTSRQTAFYDSLNKPVTVGTRIVALYKDDETDESFYAGIVAEAPNNRNELRYLVFFDDGYAQYCSSKEIHKVFFQSKSVWEDIDPNSQDFVKDYLAQYPERPMVRLHKGQTVKTEWKGKWWTARVDEVDASLVQMYFAADKRSEWIYRGSTRLEPLYTALANAEANRNAGKGKRHNLNMVMGRKPVVEYTRKDSQETVSPTKLLDQKKPVAKKSTTPRSSTEEKPMSVLNTGQVWEAPWLKARKTAEEKKKPGPKPQDKSLVPAASKAPKPGGKDIATVLQERLSVTDDVNADAESMGTRIPQQIAKTAERKKFSPHKCSKKCVPDDNPEKYKGSNPLLIPVFFGWERQVCKPKPKGRRSVFYRSPCGRRLRNFKELRKFLWMTQSELTIDLFCYDFELHIHYEFIPVKTFCDIKDISYGKEHVVISCVNGIDRQYPDYVDYSNQRIPAAGVKLNIDPEFLVCCDCTDNCQDKEKCACQQLTIEASAVINGGKPDPYVGYKNKRLLEPLMSGIYECNSRCKCDRRCLNKVVQHGLQNRLQVFKTEKCGWGLRCLDDIPHGGFICIYAGQLLNDQGADEDGQQYGDEYLAELDYIEVAEKQKEGYESDVDIDIDNMDEEDFEDEDPYRPSSDSDGSYHGVGGKRGEVMEKAHQTRRRVKIDSAASQDSDDSGVKSARGVPKKSLDKSGKPARGRGGKLRSRENNSSSKRSKDVKSPSEFSLPELDGSKTDTPVEPEKDRRKKRTGRSTGARQGMTPAKQKGKVSEPKPKDDSVSFPSTREYFQDDQSCYIMDAKSMGNIGRYLNHSCTPCAFVQNVFVDTHDLRYPWVAFFAHKYISAGSELTWDYNYEVGSVPGKVLYCYCGSAECRGRLL